MNNNSHIPDDLDKHFQGQDILETLYKDRPICHNAQHPPKASWEMALAYGGCLTCDILLCKQCYENHLEDHGIGSCVLVTLQGFLRQHPTFPCCASMSDKVEYFCLECRVATCSSCYMSAHSDHRIVDYETGAGHMIKQLNKSKAKANIKSQQCRKVKSDLKELDGRKLRRYRELRQEVKDRADRLRKWVTRAEDEMLEEIDRMEDDFKFKLDEDETLLTEVEQKADASLKIFKSCDWASQSDSHLGLVNKFITANQNWFSDHRNLPNLETDKLHHRRDYFIPGKNTSAMLRCFSPHDLLGEIRHYTSMKLPHSADKKLRVMNAAILKNNDLVLLEKSHDQYEIVVYTSSISHKGAQNSRSYYEKYVSFTGSGETSITNPTGLAVCNNRIIVMETERQAILIFSKDGIDLGAHCFKVTPRSLAGNNSGVFVGFSDEIQWLVISEDTDQSGVRVKIMKTFPVKLAETEGNPRWRYNLAVSENGDIIINHKGKLLFGSFVTNALKEVTMTSTANQIQDGRARTYPGSCKTRSPTRNAQIPINTISRQQTLQTSLLQTLTSSPAINQDHVTQFCYHGNDTVLLLDVEEEQVLAVPLADTPVKFLARTLPAAPKLLDLRQAYIVLSEKDSLVKPVAMAISNDHEIVIVQKNGEIKVFHL